MDTQSVRKNILYEEGRKNGVIRKKWYDHGRTGRTASYGPAIDRIAGSPRRQFKTGFYSNTSSI